MLDDREQILEILGCLERGVDGTTTQNRPHSAAQCQANKGPGRMEGTKATKPIDSDEMFRKCLIICCILLLVLYGKIKHLC